MEGMQRVHAECAQVTEGLRMVDRRMEGAHRVVAKCAEGMWRLQR